MVRDQRCYLSNVDTTTRNEGHSIAKAGKSLTLRMGEEKPPPCKRSRRDRSKNRVCRDAAVVMEENVWKELPEDLLEKVIARLPIPSIFRFRLVCRSWNSLLSSHRFLQQFAEVPPQFPWFYTIAHGNISNGAIYDPSMNKWYHLSLPSSPPLKTIISCHAASTGGLVCFIDLLQHKFFICNPLMMSSRELPPTARVSSHVAVGMALNKASNGYKLLWLECSGDYGVYDSVENTWSKPCDMPPHIKLPLALNFKSQTVNIDSVMYFMRTNPDGLLSFDTVKNTWQQLSIPSPQSMGHTLAVCKGHIFLVGLLSEDASTRICVWELEKMTLLWKEIDRTPDIMCREFYGKQNPCGSIWMTPCNSQQGSTSRKFSRSEQFKCFELMYGELQNLFENLILGLYWRNGTQRFASTRVCGVILK